MGRYNISLDPESVERLRWLAKQLGDIGVSATIRYLAAEQCHRQRRRMSKLIGDEPQHAA
jgi:hypothetical protein